MIYDPTNIFARILRQEIPCKEVYQDEHVLAFHDIQPEAPVHVLVIPKGEYTSFSDFVARAPAVVVSQFFASVEKVVVTLGVAGSGYRLITNHGADASQSVPHFHVHILAGRQLGKLLNNA